MVVAHRARGLRVVTYTSDHKPAHVHITGDGQTKVNLHGPAGRPEIVSVIGIKRSDMRHLMSEIAAHRDDLLQAWQSIHGNRD